MMPMVALERSWCSMAAMIGVVRLVLGGHQVDTVHARATRRVVYTHGEYGLRYVFSACVFSAFCVLKSSNSHCVIEHNYAVGGERGCVLRTTYCVLRSRPSAVSVVAYCVLRSSPLPAAGAVSFRWFSGCQRSRVARVTIWRKRGTARTPTLRHGRLADPYAIPTLLAAADAPARLCLDLFGNEKVSLELLGPENQIDEMEPIVDYHNLFVQRFGYEA